MKQILATSFLIILNFIALLPGGCHTMTAFSEIITKIIVKCYMCHFHMMWFAFTNQKSFKNPKSPQIQRLYGLKTIKKRFQRIFVCVCFWSELFCYAHFQDNKCIQSVKLFSQVDDRFVSK